MANMGHVIVGNMFKLAGNIAFSYTICPADIPGVQRIFSKPVEIPIWYVAGVQWLGTPYLPV